MILTSTGTPVTLILIGTQIIPSLFTIMYHRSKSSKPILNFKPESSNSKNASRKTKNLSNSTQNKSNTLNTSSHQHPFSIASIPTSSPSPHESPSRNSLPMPWLSTPWTRKTTLITLNLSPILQKIQKCKKNSNKLIKSRRTSKNSWAEKIRSRARWNCSRLQ